MDQEPREQVTFRPDQSELERSPEKILKYVQLLEEALGNGFRVVGILEMGSYSKGEAVPGSDIDTRVYVESPEAYAWQTAGGKFVDSQKDELERKYEKFTSENEKPRVEFDWKTFNKPLIDSISNALGSNIDFGIADRRFIEFELERMDVEPTNDHHILLEGNILYDPENFLKSTKRKYEGKRFRAMVDHYQDRYLDALPFEIYKYVVPDEQDAYKVEKNGQIQWVKWAVRCLRDAVASKTYIKTGKFVYKKPDVLTFYKQYMPEEYDFVEELYSWKCVQNTRKRIVEEFNSNQAAMFQVFKEKTKRLEAVVQKVNHLPLS